MAEIKMIYKQGYCAAYGNTEDFYCNYCYTEFAENLGCPECTTLRSKAILDASGNIHGVISYAACDLAGTLEKHKGLTTKHYEAYIDEDPYNPGEECAMLEVGKRRYICKKLIIDGEQIFPEESEETEETE